MFAYQHGYHAGNFADVLKHAAIAAIAAHLAAKDKPFFYLDTHAGAGRYRLDGPQAARLGEFRHGIVPVLAARDAPEALQPFLSAVAALNPDGMLRDYPGSPLVVRHFMRARDRMSLHELHPAEFAALRRALGEDARARLAREDGLAAIASELPPRERRGLVLVDPAYEANADYREVPRAIERGLRRFATGIFVLWYPQLGRRANAGLARAVLDLHEHALHAELAVRAPHLPGLTGCGLVVLNPPWTLQAQLAQLLPWLARCLAPEEGRWRLAPPRG
ncbi:MAG: 23S rRNA (adenine(2030)-N(6))-methyltransferase RlmJ [Gammaproteobacteria bacterium]